MRYWINTVSREHVHVGMSGGFTQADHGSDRRLKRVSNGDAIVFYSPRTEFRAGEALQRFTAIGYIIDDAPYQVEMTADFHPWRRRMRFVEAEEVPIAPLIEHLDFIVNKKSWGFTFRRGFFEIGEVDFERIAKEMSATVLRRE